MKYDETGLPVRAKPKLEGVLTVRGTPGLWDDLSAVMRYMFEELHVGASITDAVHFALRQYVLSMPKTAKTAPETQPDAPAVEVLDVTGGKDKAPRSRRKKA